MPGSKDIRQAIGQVETLDDLRALRDRSLQAAQLAS